MEVEAGSQTGDSALTRLVIAFTLTHGLLQPFAEQGADRGAFLGG